MIWTRCRRVWSFVDIITFTVFREVWLSLYTLYIFSWHFQFSVATSMRYFIFAINSFSSSWWVMTKVNSLNLLSSSQLIFIAIIVTFSLLSLSTDNEIHLYVMSTTNLLILFCVQIEVKRVKRSQFNAVQTMLERCVIRKVVVQSFHSRDNISSNSHNRSTKKINDMSMSVRDEKILLVKKTTQVKSLRVVTTSDRRICDSSTASISKRLHHIDSVVE